MFRELGAVLIRLDMDSYSKEPISLRRVLVGFMRFDFIPVVRRMSEPDRTAWRCSPNLSPRWQYFPYSPVPFSGTRRNGPSLALRPS